MLTFSQLLLQIVPFTFIGLLASGLGAWKWPVSPTPSAILIRTLMLLLSFLGLIGLKRIANWNVAMLVLFAFILGSFAKLIPSAGSGNAWGYSLGIAGCLLFVSYQVSRNARIRTGELSIGLWLLAWIYVFGWVGLFLLDLGMTYQKIWSGFGLLLFTGMSFIWFSSHKTRDESIPGSSMGIDIYLLSLNLMFASNFLLSSTGP